MISQPIASRSGSGQSLLIHQENFIRMTYRSAQPVRRVTISCMVQLYLRIGIVRKAYGHKHNQLREVVSPRVISK